MPDNLKKALVGLILLVGTSSTSYVIFSKYTPKILRKLEEVKGVTTVSADTLPYPPDSKKIGFFETSKVKQTTLQTKKDLGEIDQFYRNIYLSKRYYIVSEKNTDTLLELKFKKGGEKTVILATRQEDSDYTTFSIEVSK